MAGRGALRRLQAPELEPVLTSTPATAAGAAALVPSGGSHSSTDSGVAFGIAIGAVVLVALIAARRCHRAKLARNQDADWHTKWGAAIKERQASQSHTGADVRSGEQLAEQDRYWDEGLPASMAVIAEMAAEEMPTAASSSLSEHSFDSEEEISEMMAEEPARAEAAAVARQEYAQQMAKQAERDAAKAKSKAARRGGRGQLDAGQITRGKQVVIRSAAALKSELAARRSQAPFVRRTARASSIGQSFEPSFSPRSSAHRPRSFESSR